MKLPIGIKHPLDQFQRDPMVGEGKKTNLPACLTNLYSNLFFPCFTAFQEGRKINLGNRRTHSDFYGFINQRSPSLVEI